MAVDICWAAVTDNDRVEHIFTGTSWDLINLVFFVRCDSFDEAKGKVLGLWRRASQGSRLLRGRFEVEVGSLEWT